jgi:hypothetical protein
LECLIYLHEHGCEWTSETCYHALDYPDCLRYLQENGCEWV